MTTPIKPAAKTVNLVTCSGKELRDFMSEVTKLGIMDATEGKPELTGWQLVEHFQSQRILGGYREGHKRFIKSAYMLGRWHVELQGSDS